MGKIEIDKSVLLKIDHSIGQALHFLRSAKEIEVTAFYNGIETVIDDLSDSLCRISEQVKQLKERE